MSQVSYGTITISDLTDIDSIVNYYLATDLSSGVTKDDPASGHGVWTTNIQNATLTSTFQYLWNYEKILGAGNIEISSTNPIIIGHFGINGTNGTNGVDGNSITSIDEYYQATNSTSNPGSSGWSINTLVVPTSTNRYLWNYQVIHYSKTADEGSYNDARIIGVYGERGTSILKVTTAPTATSGTISGFSYSYRMSLSTVKTQSGKNEVLVGDIIEYNSNHYQVGYVSSSYVYLGSVTSIKGADGQTYYTWIKYAPNDNPTNTQISDSPTGMTYIGIYTGTTTPAPSTASSYAPWMKYIGTDGGQGPQGVSVTNVRELYWLKTNSTNPSQITWNSSTSQPSQTIYSTDRQNSWTSMVPTYIADGIYYTCIETSLSDGTKVWSAPVVNQALTDANSNATNAQGRVNAAELNITALQSKLAYMWSNLSDRYYDGDTWDKPDYPAGTYMASGIENTNFDTENSDTYGYNTLLRHNKLALRYNNIDMTTLTTGALTFYRPTQQNGEWIQGIVGLEINSDGLDLYGSLTSEPDAFLDINGLNLLRGGIVAGVTNTKDFVYLSSNNFAQEIEPFYRLTLDEAIIPNKNYYEYDEENDIYNEVNSPTVDDINLYYEYMTPLPGTIAIDNFNKTDWKQIIGTNFAVDLEGNLYALNANINGIINATSGIIGGFTIGNNELYSNNKIDVKSTEEGTYIGPLGFNISDGKSENTTFFTSDEVSIGGVLNWKAGEDNNPGNLSIKADEIIIGIDYMPTNDAQPIEGKIYYYLSGEEYIEFQGNTFDSNVEYYEPIDFMVKSLLQDSIKVNNNQTIKIDELEDMVNNIRNITNSYKEFITTVINGNNSYIDFQYQNETYNPKLKITTNSISFSLDEDENIVTQITKINNDSLMHTTFGEFENLRMRAGGQGNLTWIARDNGHLSLKVVE